MRTPFLSVLMFLCFCCSPSLREGDRGKIRVFVGIPPQAYFVERVGGSYVSVSVLVRPGESPHTFEPTAKQMAEISQAKLYFKIGLPFENHLIAKLKKSVKGLKVVDTTAGVEFRFFGDVSGGSLSDGLPDPHIWLDPMRVKVVAENICKALKRIDPLHSADYDRNLESFHNDLDSLHKRISSLLSPYEGREFFVFHPAFGYFATSYGLRQVAVEKEGKEPGGKHLASVIEEAKAKSVKVIFVQPQFVGKGAQAVADAIGASLVTINALAYDYLNNLEDIARKIKEAFE